MKWIGKRTMRWLDYLGEDFYINVYANSEQDAVEKATENVWSFMPEEEFDIIHVKEIK